MTANRVNLNSSSVALLKRDEEEKEKEGDDKESKFDIPSFVSIPPQDKEKKGVLKLGLSRIEDKNNNDGFEEELVHPIEKKGI
jgi:hypothetical protein